MVKLAHYAVTRRGTTTTMQLSKRDAAILGGVPVEPDPITAPEPDEDVETPDDDEPPAETKPPTKPVTVPNRSRAAANRIRTSNARRA